jgi:hypothetical protein
MRTANGREFTRMGDQELLRSLVKPLRGEINLASRLERSGGLGTDFKKDD